MCSITAAHRECYYLCVSFTYRFVEFVLESFFQSAYGSPFINSQLLQGFINGLLNCAANYFSGWFLNQTSGGRAFY